ncbi:Zinc finger BED domain-containing protein DAYSLEEPER [Glycine max]|nr:Zinc finger BED domain-containing protein DAYSLEEPER [Glycine max]
MFISLYISALHSHSIHFTSQRRFSLSPPLQWQWQWHVLSRVTLFLKGEFYMQMPIHPLQRVTRAIMEFVACANPDNNDEISDSETQPNKWMRKKSMVWDYFTVETVGAGCTRAYCKQCKKSFSYITDSKLTGTSHLKRHISLGICRVLREKNQQRSYPKTGGSLDTANPLKKRPRATPGFAGNGISFYQEHCNHDVAKMIILHDYPLHIVKQQGFIDFVWMLQPQFNPFCLNSVEADCVAMHLRKK